MSTRPPQITDAHCRRRAIAYLRQSSIEQVRDNIGSTALQRDLPQLLQEWGWPAEQIDVIDGDLGVTGSVPGLRQGFSDLLAQMEAGTVGLVAVVDSSRLTRNLLDLARFASVARKYDVLLAQAGQIVDFSDPNSEFVGMILNLNAVRENRTRTDLGRRARRKKAEAGLAITAPPVGYVRIAPGVWDKDPNPRIRDAIQLVFDKFDEFGTVGRVVRYFRRHDVQTPRRGRGSVRWTLPTRPRIYKMLQQRAYAGMYVYGKTAADQSGDVTARGKTRQLARPADKWITIENHHPAYITPERWALIQDQLAKNRATRIAPLGRGNALLQGLLRCRTHRLALKTQYPTGHRSRRHPSGRVAYYRCAPFVGTHAESTICGNIRAARLDALVEAELLRTLAPPSIDCIQEATRAAFREHDARARARQDEVHRAEQAMAEAERAYDQAGSAHVHLKQRLADRLEEALCRLDGVRAEHRLHPLVPPPALDAAELGELRQLAADLPRLWSHPRVSAAQRKLIVRSVIEAISVVPSHDVWTVDIDWVGGARTALQVATSRHVHTVIRERYDAGCTVSQVVDHLQASGFVRLRGTQAGQPYTEAVVKDQIRRLKLQRPFDTKAYPLIRARTEAGISTVAIAAELNTQGIRHRFGAWTRRLVEKARGRLRRGQIPDVAPLPIPAPFKARALELHDLHHSPRAIAAILRAEGWRTRHRTVITDGTIRAIFRQLKLRTHDALGNELVTAHLTDWAPTSTVPEMTRRLDMLGLTTLYGRRWTESSVSEKLRDLGIRMPDRRRREARGRRAADEPSQSKETPTSDPSRPASREEA